MSSLAPIAAMERREDTRDSEDRSEALPKADPSSSQSSSISLPTEMPSAGGSPPPSQVTDAMSPSQSYCPSASERPATENNNIKITLLHVEPEEPASIYYPSHSFKLIMEVEGTFFLGAVQLKSSDCNAATIDLINAAGCITENVENCDFQRDDLKSWPVTPTAGTKRQGWLAKQERMLYSITLPPLKPENGSLVGNYVLEIAWATIQNPSRNASDIKYASADNPTDPSQELLITGVTSSIPEPGFSATSTGSPTHTTPFPLNPTAIASAATEPNPAATDPSLSAPPQQNKDGGGGGLSTGAKAGIAVGAVLGVLAIVALIFLCLRRRKFKRKTSGGYFGDAPGNSDDFREKEAGVGIAAIPFSSSPNSDGHHTHNGAAAILGRGNSGRVVDGASLKRDVGGHAAPVAGVGATRVARKPIGSRGVSDGEPVGKEGAISWQSQVLSDEERARWEEEERRLDEDIAEAERRRLAQ